MQMHCWCCWRWTMTTRVLRHPKLKLFLGALFVLFVFLACQLLPVRYYLSTDSNYYLTQDGFYLLISPTCRIVNLDPWNEDARRYYVKKPYYNCATRAILTEMVLGTNDIDVYIQYNHEIPEHELPTNLQCCAANITRARVPSSHNTFDDNQIQLSECMEFYGFPHKVSNEYPSYIRCVNVETSDLYENIHQPIALTEGVRQKLKRAKHKLRANKNQQRKRMSVLVLGIDSISKLNLIRTMPHTYNFLQTNPNWLEYKIFQKMGDNTMPNLMAILTGFNLTQAYNICEPLKPGGLDNCPFIWKRFSDRGYVTMYSEDLAKISTFNYEKPGFNTSSVDYYTRPYHLGAAHYLPPTLFDSSLFCSGLVQDGERVWNVAKDFARLHNHNPHFGFFWTNSYSHEDVNTPGRMDDKVRDYLLEISDIVEDTFIIFLSDHGIRFGGIRNTLTGYLEERLPFLYFHFPKWFQLEYPDQYAVLKMNTQRMVTPYDIYMTLQQVLNMADDEYKIEASQGCPKCRSLMELIPLERSCDDANVTDHWCTCSNLMEIDPKGPKIQTAAEVAVGKLNELIGQLRGEEMCERFRLDHVFKAFQATNHYGGNDDLVVVEFETSPTAKFEVSMHTGNMEMYGGFSRLDSYKATSACTNNPNLQMFCYCKEASENISDRTNGI